MAKAEAARREQTRRLLQAGALHTGEDYQHAAFVFQHGDSPADYLLAHTLAMVAVTKGKATAIWIAAATLDRYLQKIGQKQIFGTQFLTHSENGAEVWTQRGRAATKTLRQAFSCQRSAFSFRPQASVPLISFCNPRNKSPREPNNRLQAQRRSPSAYHL